MKTCSTLKLVREQSGKTQAQTAREIGIGVRLYQDYEYGAKIPNVVTGNKIARLLKTTSEKLWGYGDKVQC